MFTVFRNEEVFGPEYVPDSFQYREAQMTSLAYCMRPAMRGSKPLNALLLGPPATGKTTALKIAMGQLEESSNAICIQMNCSNTTTYRILSEIHKKVIGYLPPETGVPISKLRDAIFKKLDKRSLVIVLDDVHDFHAISDTAHIILRAHESYPGVKAGVMIASTKNGFIDLNESTRSSFSPEIIEFSPYNSRQAIDILKKRADLGFFPGVASSSIIEKIVERADDIREAIEMLRTAGIKAEASSRKKIIEEDISKAERRFEDDIEKIIIKEINKQGMDTGTLYEKVKPVSYSKFYRTLKKLESQNIITTEEITKGRGKSRMVKLRE